MSKETSKWLNQNTLIGFTDKRGTAWHYRAEDQGSETNHYTGAVPVEDVQRRLFNWSPEPTPLYVPDGNGGFRQLADRQAILRSDNGYDMGIFRSGYEPHDYSEWLLTNVSNILDDDLQVGSAGLLSGGGKAWVSVEVSENVKTPQGLEFRPNLVAATSFDGSLATTYKETATAIVCDNTLAAGLGDAGRKFKAKHTKNSQFKIADAREALGIVHTIAEDFMAELELLSNTKLTDHQFEQVVDLISPMPKEGDHKSNRGASRANTQAESRRESLWALWNNDERVNPWRNTALGAYQAYNTYQHHIRGTRGGTAAERNMLDMVTGRTEANDNAMVSRILELAS